MRNKLIIIMALCISSLISFNLASAEIERVTMQIDGMTCPFCIFGIEKKLKSVDEVKDAEANLRSGNVDLTMEENAVISIKRLNKAVDDSGFTPGDIEIEASGKLEQYKLGDKDYPALKVSGSDQIFLLTDSRDHGQEEYLGSEKLKELSDTAAKNDGNITITGYIHQHSEDLPLALSVGGFKSDSN